MCEGGMFEKVLLNKMVIATLRKALGSEKDTQDLLHTLGMTEDSVASMVIDAMRPSRGTLTTQDCIDVLSGTYCDRFNPSMCVVYYSGKTQIRGVRSNSHCGRPVRGRNVCCLCANTPEGINVSNKMQSGCFDAAEYRKVKTTSRYNLAKSRLRASGVNHYYVDGKLFVGQGNDTYYCRELNLCVKRRLVDNVYKTITVGLGQEGEEQICYSMLMLLKDISITVNIDSINPQCLEIIKKKMNRSG